MSNNNMVYIRTDKNGTKIYHDYTCPRCGGAGGADQWIYTGWTCYECGGTGRVSNPQIIKDDKYHKCHEKRHPGHIDCALDSLAHRMSRHELPKQEHQPPAVKRRKREQVHDSEVCREHDHEI